MKFLCVLCALCGFQSFALDREAFTFTNYDLDVRVEPEQQRLAVRGKLILRNDSASAQKNLCLQISSTLDWRSIQIGGKPVQFVTQPYTSDIDHTGVLSEAIVTLPQPVLPKGTIELEIGYEGTIPLDATRLTRIGVPEELAKHSDWDQIGRSFTAVRGIGYVAWYPVAIEAANLSEGNSVFSAAGRWKRREAEASMRIRLETPVLAAEASAPIVRCSGQTMYTVTRGGSPKFPAAECSYVPMNFVVSAFVIADYDLLDRPTAQVYYLPDHRDAAENYALAADVCQGMVRSAA